MFLHVKANGNDIVVVMETVPLMPPTTYQFNLDDYQRIIEAGILANNKVELIRGGIITMAPMGN